MFNQFIGIGNLSAAPEIRYTQDGKGIANFTVCCETGWGDKKKTEFVKCVAFGKLAEVAGQYLNKGSKVMVQGPMQTRKWTDKSGTDRWSTEIIVNEMRMLSPKERDIPDAGEPYQHSKDDVPF